MCYSVIVSISTIIIIIIITVITIVIISPCISQHTWFPSRFPFSLSFFSFQLYQNRGRGQCTIFFHDLLTFFISVSANFLSFHSSFSFLISSPFMFIIVLSSTLLHRPKFPHSSHLLLYTVSSPRLRILELTYFFYHFHPSE